MKKLKIALLFSLISLVGSCSVNSGSNSSPAKPELEIKNGSEGDKYRKLDSETIRLSLNAEGADRIDLMFQPVSASEDKTVLLKRLEPAKKMPIETEIPVSEDFTGEIWAVAHYKGPKIMETSHIPVTTDSSKQDPALDQKPDDRAYKSEDDETVHSDRFTKENSRKKELSITVNLPAFRLTVWRDGRELKSYPIGIGRKNFPVPVGEREATSIIFNPAWIPPNSSWVRSSPNVEPYEHIEAADPRNPLGSVKIPLGGGYLIHEAASPSDIGSLVSHGCIRMLKGDIYDLSMKIINSRSLPFSSQDLQRVKQSEEKEVVKLDPAVPVDINYDMIAIKDGRLNIFPDVYERETSSFNKLKTELEQEAIDLDTNSYLKDVLGRLGKQEKFVVAISDLKRQKDRRPGEFHPVVEIQKKETAEKKKESSS